MAKRDFYDILGLSRSATDAQVKSAYRKLARKYHPDVNKAADAEDKFKEATEAYEVLSDPKKRQMYDQFGHAGPNVGYGPAGRGGPRVYTHAGGRGVGGFDFADFFGGGGGSGFAGMGLDDILQALGGAGPRRSRRAPTPPKGADTQYEIKLDFLQAVSGSSVSLKVHRKDPSGKSRTETINVKIPAGVKEGAKIRVRGKGAEGPGGFGDLYIITHINPHPYFRKEGDDIYVEVPVSIVEATLGAKVDVPTLDGMTSVKIPAGTNSSRKLRLKGKGVKQGDQYVIIKIVPPEKVSQESQKLLRQFESQEKFDPRADVSWK